jgi:adenosylcobyric acid synthase
VGATSQKGLACWISRPKWRLRKTVRNITARSAEWDLPLEGYEIHLGVSQGPDCIPSDDHPGRPPDGAISPDGKVSGTYLHGLFGADAYRARAAGRALAFAEVADDFREDVDAALDEIAAELDRLVGFERMMQASGVIGR